MQPPPPSPPYALKKVPPTQKPYKINGKTYYPLATADGYRETGLASWYGPGFQGRPTANGERYDMNGPTAAHKTLPINTQVLVRNLENGRETVVRINDRGPFVRGRIIDLSLASAKELDVVRSGTAKVEVVALGESVAVPVAGGSEQRFLPQPDFDRGEFYVQIGSFINKDNALGLQARMKLSGRATVIELYDSGQALFHRVRVVAGPSLAGAQRLAQQLASEGLEGYVVAR